MPRIGLTSEAVIEEAGKMVDDLGLEKLTLAGLAGRLGIRQPSLYKHIEGIAGLRRSITIRAISEANAVLARAAVGRSRGDAVSAMAVAHREWAHAHPGRYQASQSAHTPGAGDTEFEKVAMDYIQLYSDVLSGFGLAGEDAIDAIRAVRSALHGFISLEAAGYFTMPLDIDRSYRRLVAALVTALEHWSTGPHAATLPLS